MPLSWILLILAVIGTIAFLMARSRAIATVDGDARRLHSLPIYYGLNGALMALTPALGLLAIWLLVQPILLDRSILADLPAGAVPDGGTAALVMSDVRRVADGIDSGISSGSFTRDELRDLSVEDVGGLLASEGTALGSALTGEVLTAATSYWQARSSLSWIMTIAVIGLALIGGAWAVSRSRGEFRARNVVERGVLILMIAAASIAILTTLGIVLSLLFETANFFRQYSWTEFFFSTTWSPSFSGRGGASQLGILPLLWGTLYISTIALIVAVPIGLFAAIYLSEYAGKKFRSVAKPLIEILAGIPTIVYGLFALITVGPFLRDAFASPLGLGNSASSVMTAGLVMGIMLIPFVSSLSDDIINAVPQAMRDGSLGLGATKSETIRQVIVPAALPGIVGAVLLAASRAIGETMIVVLGAGAAARLDLNPFEAMTTVTVKIVSQLTGDTDFASPETLVAFALGLTLFVITLGLNVLALFIVRKYREQYE
ncbi:MAG: phosphate ABC transporter permease subunit PstC [Jannaschia helgolandensis]|jgi:phosphate transport system permease protein|uniref:Phosphate transport system permease protein n=1 Tax=Jannaschia helgolandensis TaxID=188906 RepID=A0A1H7KSP9_9RHOB|nr:phosphate ABC transporter permease subunit PstC [Jannaschia helgolandensis]SEK89772.1 phosphate ABC transporter membrane protein 1, PhoT family [Jannaschia helgolandensis]